MDNKSWELVSLSQLPAGRIPILHKGIGNNINQGTETYHLNLNDVWMLLAVFNDLPFILKTACLPQSLELSRFTKIMSIVASENLKMVQINIKTAFLNADFDKPICRSSWLNQKVSLYGKEDLPVLLKNTLYST